jgi:hypothetical protein
MKEHIKAKEIVKGKFWIVEDEGVRIGTLSMSDERFMFSDLSGTRFFNNKTQLQKTLGKKLDWLAPSITEIDAPKEVHGYPTSTKPFNAMFDVKRKLPLFTKSEKSKSLYCAGYYIIHFDKGWVKSFCPKQITVERYDTQGPFKTEIEMRTALSKANAK